MLARFTTSELPRSRSPEQVKLLLDRMNTDGLPSFVIKSAGTSYDEVFGFFGDAFRRAGFTPNFKHPIEMRYERPPLEFRALKDRAQRSPVSSSGARYPDIRLHMDSAPDLSDDEVSNLGLNLVQKGGVEVTLFEPTVEFAAQRSRDLDSGSHGRMHDLFMHGLIDEDILKPKAYRTRLKKGDLIVFRISGRLSLAHHFRTKRYPRISQACTATKIGVNSDLTPS